MYPLRPTDPSFGFKPVMQSRNVLIEQEDAQRLKKGDKVTLLKWGNFTITRKVEKGKYLELFATYNPDGNNWKDTIKLCWLCNDPDTTFEIFVKENRHTEYSVIAEGVVRNLAVGTLFQFESRGFYQVDQIELFNQPMIVSKQNEPEERKEVFMQRIPTATLFYSGSLADYWEAILTDS